MEISRCINRLAACLGIEDHWYDFRGERHETSPETTAALV
jgi:hypothetical protein